MRSDEIEVRAREAADIGSVAAWSDWPATKIHRIASARHASLMSDEEIRARAGYGVQKQLLTCVVGTDLYPVPARAIGGSFEKLEFQQLGQTKWTRIDRVEVTGSEEFEMGPTIAPGRPERFCVQDGFVQLYPSPNAAYPLRFTFYMRPSKLVQSQSSTLVGAGDAVDRGRITVKSSSAPWTVTVNAVPFDQLLGTPAAITSGLQLIDIVRPNGTFACAAYSQAQTLAGSVFTLTAATAADMARVQIGDYVRVADQTDWPMGLPEEAHEMVALRTAMEIARDIGVDEKVVLLGAAVQADLERFRNSRTPQVKSAPRVIPLRPMFLR